MSILYTTSQSGLHPHSKIRTHVFRPLCVALPLAKKSASMYSMRPPPYNMTDPMSVHPIMYASDRLLATSLQRVYSIFACIQCRVMKLACGASALRLDGVRSLSHATEVIQGANMAVSRRRQGRQREYRVSVADVSNWPSVGKCAAEKGQRRKLGGDG